MDTYRRIWEAFLICLGLCLGVLVSHLEIYPVQSYGVRWIPKVSNIRAEIRSTEQNNVFSASRGASTPELPLMLDKPVAQTANNNSSSSPRVFPSLKRGKEIVYQPINSHCLQPQYLPGYGDTLCWNVNITKAG